MGSISATPLREAYYRGEIQTEFFPQGSIQFLQEFQNNEIYRKLQDKYQQRDMSNI